jgi:nitrite reductase/ring-hydroxylating ferredoxin subunit
VAWWPVPSEDGPGEGTPPGGVRGVESDGRDLVVWVTAGGRVCAVDGRCPHQWSPLAEEGVVEGDELVCRAHAWRFDVHGDGWKDTVLGRRDPKSAVRTYAVRRHGGRTEVDLP